MSSVDELVARGGEADEVLRGVVGALVAGGYRWAGIFFVEGSEVTLGPTAGVPDESSRRSVPVVWQGVRVAELAADGASGEPLEPVAGLIAAHCLVGWDTGGEPWSP
jgi:hypothetical protein